MYTYIYIYMCIHMYLRVCCALLVRVRARLPELTGRQATDPIWTDNLDGTGKNGLGLGA